jgi:hypothetical protein
MFINEIVVNVSEFFENPTLQVNNRYCISLPDAYPNINRLQVVLLAKRPALTILLQEDNLLHKTGLCTTNISNNAMENHVKLL